MNGERELTGTEAQNGAQLPNQLTAELLEIAEDNERSEPQDEAAPETPPKAELTAEQAAELTAKLDSFFGYEAPEPAEMARLLTEASNAELPGLPDHLRKLRHARNPGSPHRHVNVHSGDYDAAVVTLLESGQDELATSLISSSDRDRIDLTFAAHRVLDDPEAAGAIQDKVTAISAAKRARLRETLETNGASAQLIDGLIERAGDPDDAATVTPEAWKGLGRVHPETIIELAADNYDLPGTVDIVGDLSANGLTAESRKLVPRMLKDADPDARTTYLASYKRAREAIIPADEPYPKAEVTQKVDTLIDFADPSAALDAVHKIYGPEPTLTQTLQFADLCPKDEYTNKTRTFTPGFVEGVGLTRAGLAELPINDAYRPGQLKDISDSIRNSDDPKHEAQLILKNLEAGRSALERDQSVAHYMSRATDRQHFAGALQQIEGSLEATSPEEAKAIIMRLSNEADAAGLAGDLATAYEILNARNIKLEDITSQTVMAEIKRLKDGKPDLAPEDMKAGLEKLCQNYLVAAEAEKAHASQYEARLTMSDAERRATPRRMKLKDFPETANRLGALGLDEATQHQLFDTWADYDEMVKFQMSRPGHKSVPLKDIPAETFERMAKAHGEKLVAQVDAVETYAEKYGPEELKATMEIFGIANFDRYPDGLLHKQYEAWQTGALPVENIIVSAKRGDYNGAQSHAGREFSDALPDQNNVFFEAASARELSQAMVAVGKRERKNGRDPKTENNVKNVIINGHASADGIGLGANGEGIRVRDYLEAATQQMRNSNLRPNDYQRELGSEYRVILKACSTASENIGGRANIAESISERHATQVEASPIMTSGAVTIDRNNRVTFSTHDEELDTTTKTRAVTYGARHKQLPFAEDEDLVNQVKTALGPETEYDPYEMPEA